MPAYALSTYLAPASFSSDDEPLPEVHLVPVDETADEWEAE